MKTENSIQAVLFDLGGVLIDFVGIQKFRELLPETVTYDVAYNRWVSSEALGKFEQGLTASEEFADEFITEWQIELSATAFLEHFRSWIKGPLPGALKLLDELAPIYTLACLSNTSEAHWDIMIEDLGLNSRLEYKFASHLVGVTKPKKKCFETVCEEMNLEPFQILFFDDSNNNIVSATEFGMNAFRVDGPAEVRKKMMELGLIGSAE